MTSGSRSSDDPAGARPPMSPGVPESALAAIDTHLKERERRRDDLAERARRLRRAAQGAMTRLHEGRGVDAEIADVRSTLGELARRVRAEGRGDEGLAQDAIQEGVEATLLSAVARAEALPGPEELGVEPEPYLLGLGDVVGEVRRLALASLAEGALARAEAYLGLMDRLYLTLMRFEAPRGIVQLKPKQDSARALVEKTRGEVTMARVLSRLPWSGPPPTASETEGE
jgi:translin